MDRTALAALADDAQRKLGERPSLSIRTRLGVGFAVWILLSVGLAVASLLTLDRIRDKLHVMEATASYTFEIQQARRFEKNFFLYGTNIKDALQHVDFARRLFEAERAKLAEVVDRHKLDTMARHLEVYEEELRQVPFPGSDVEGARPVDREQADLLEGRIREHGAVMVSAAEDVLAKERAEVDSLLAFSQRIPLGFLVLLVLLIAYLSWFIARQMLAPLNRMMEVTHRVADGDFTMVMPKRRYRDELSELAMAMNHMMYQLLLRQDMLVKAHKLEAVGTLTAGIAHELNNPINNIMLTAATLEDDYADYSDAERRELARDLVSESERARKIVRNLLDFARESEADVDALDIREIVEDTLRLASNQIKLAKVKVRGEITENLPSLHGDRQQLQQVLLNFVLNALDAMHGGGTLTISLDVSDDRDWLVITVQDTGTGIPEEHLGQIFDPFFSSKAKGRGTGLGLSVSLNIIRQHGGDIRVHSKVGKGTTFTVLLPVTKVPADLSSGME
jgi:two-component system NtrC family sensor kinase